MNTNHLLRDYFLGRPDSYQTNHFMHPPSFYTKQHFLSGVNAQVCEIFKNIIANVCIKIYKYSKHS